MLFDQAARTRGLIAIIRGVTPAEAEAVCGALVEAGVAAIEAPLNSPDPFRSIEIMAKRFGDVAAIGAGTVLNAGDAARVARAGGVFAVAPNTAPDVIAAALSAKLEPVPGFATPTEAFAAIAAGARHLKLFPAGAFGPAYLTALLAVTPSDARIYAVGAVGDDAIAAWLSAGAAGLGLGSSLYKPGDAPADIGARARRAVEIFDQHKKK